MSWNIGEGLVGCSSVVLCNGVGIGSWICLTARQPYASPPGYQSPALGDNIPDLGSQDTIGMKPHYGSVPPTCYNNNTLANSAPYLSHSCAHQEDTNTSSVSQWWGHCGLHLEVQELGENKKGKSY